LFIFSGGELILGSHQNFLYVIQSYEALNWFPLLENVAAYAMPWIEFYIGVFIFLGLRLNYALGFAFLMVNAFIIIVGQAILRKLPITDCGCFGESIHFSLETVIAIDVALLVITTVLLYRLELSSYLSLDSCFAKKQQENV